MLRQILPNLAFVFALFSANLYAGNINDIIGQNIKGTQILDVRVLTIPNDDGLMLVLKTSAGERKFIVTKEDIVSALALLQNPQAYGANNALLFNRTIPHIPSAKPLGTAQNQAKSPIIPTAPVTTVTPNAPAATVALAPTPVATQTFAELPSNASAIVSSVVLSSNQQASK